LNDGIVEEKNSPEIREPLRDFWMIGFLFLEEGSNGLFFVGQL
jgi:hypothetical protein